MKRLLIIVFAFLAFTGFAQKKSKKDYVVTISTSFGDMVAILYDETPKHKENFIKLVDSKFYDSTTFHRIINQFMIQGGDPNSKDDNPNNDGNGGPGYTTPAEFSPDLFHKKGALSAARMGDQVNPKKESSGSQFYIVQGKTYTDRDIEMMKNRGFKLTDESIKAYKEIGGTPHLDGGYTVFGEVISGLEVIDEIAKQPKDRRDRPTTNIYMKVSGKSMKKKKITKMYGYQY